MSGHLTQMRFEARHTPVARVALDPPHAGLGGPPSRRFRSTRIARKGNRLIYSAVGSGQGRLSPTTCRRLTDAAIDVIARLAWAKA